MGFFSDLKEDLTQAVNELSEETVEKEMKSEEEKLAEEVNNLQEEPSELERQLKEYLEGNSMVVEDTAQEANDETAEEEPSEELSNLEEEVNTEMIESEQPQETIKDEVNTEEAVKNKDTENLGEQPTVRKTQETTVKGVEKRMDTKGRNASDETAVITAGMIITGDICSEGSMDVIGSIVGNIDILGKLNVTGTIQGDSKATEIYAESAKITGSVNSQSSVKIGQNCVVIGDIVANSAVIAGAVKGDIDVHGPVILDTSAIVMGNIRSRSVQINNGAVVEGMCSQCYAEVNPSSFFENIGKEVKKTK